MASLTLLASSLLLLWLLALSAAPSVAAVDARMDEASLSEWPTAMSIYDNTEEQEEQEDIEYGFSRRSLFWQRMKYYISYGALSANRIPCPPRSGRSYYTHNCYKARGPVHPYSRGCSAITRCRR